LFVCLSSGLLHESSCYDLLAYLASPSVNTKTLTGEMLVLLEWMNKWSRYVYSYKNFTSLSSFSFKFVV
jgi:hypothetical protein